MKHRINALMSIFIGVSLLSGCSNDSKEKNRWNYTKEDMAFFYNFECDIDVQDNTMFMKLNEDVPVFSKEVKKEDLLVFAANKIQESIKEGKYDADYLTYDDYAKYAVSISSIENTDHQSLNVGFAYNPSDDYSILVNKDVFNGETFAFINPRISNIDVKELEQLKFEENLINQENPTWDQAKGAINLIGSIAQIVVGKLSNGPTAIAAGIFGILTSLGDLFGASSGPTIKDVLDKLAEMDKKLNQIQTTLDKNHNQLLSETVRTQAQIDKVLLNQYEANISSFVQNHVQPLDDLKRNFADYAAQQFKKIIKADSTTIILGYVKNDQGEYDMVDDSYTGPLDFGETYELKGFKQCKDLLAKNNDVLVSGFMDCFAEDVLDVVKERGTTHDLKAEKVRDDIMMKVNQKFTQEYYEEATRRDAVLALKNKAINISKVVSGEGMESILTSYIQRLRFMYNFASEVKNTETHLLASLRKMLDQNVAFASTACLYAKVDQTDLGDAYLAARKAISDVQKAGAKIDDNYCYANEMILSGDLYRSMWNIEYQKKGNYPKYTTEFVVEKVCYGQNDYDVKFEKQDLKKFNPIANADYLRIAQRLKLMAALGLTDKTNFRDYLQSTNIISKEANWMYTRLIARKWMSEDANRFICSDIRSRDMGTQDKGTVVHCVEKGGLEKTNYFEVGKQYTYGVDHLDTYWSGHITEATFIDGDSGEIMDNKTVCSVALYNESHKGWIRDEHWAFKDNPVGNYFFSLYTK